MADDDMGTISIWASKDLADDLDEMADRWGEHSELKVKRSVPGRQALVIGLQVLEMLENEYGTRRVQKMDLFDKKAAARQGMVEYFKLFDESDGDGDV